MNSTTNTKRRARQTRAAARQSLKPYYWWAVLACLIASVLGVATLSSVSFDLSAVLPSEEEIVLPEGNEELTWEALEQLTTESYEQTRALLEEVPPIVWGIMSVVLAFSVLFAIAYTWVGYCIRLGLCRFELSLTDGEHPSIGTLFSYFGRAFWRSVGMNIVRNLIVFLIQLPSLAAGLMSVGVLVNGVVKLWGTPAMTDEVATYILTMVGQFFGLMLISMALLLLSLPVVLRYSMADYVLCENPEVGALGALRESRRMMKGNKWRLFCLQFSFIGWRLLASVVGSIGYIFLNPYLEQANAEFYHEISGRAAVREAVNELDAPMADLT